MLQPPPAIMKRAQLEKSKTVWSCINRPSKSVMIPHRSKWAINSKWTRLTLASSLRAALSIQRASTTTRPGSLQLPVDTLSLRINYPRSKSSPRRRVSKSVQLSRNSRTCASSSWRQRQWASANHPRPWPCEVCATSTETHCLLNLPTETAVSSRTHSRPSYSKGSETRDWRSTE